MHCAFLLKIASLLIFFAQNPAQADQFLSDSPVPTPYENIFTNTHIALTHTKNGSVARLPALETFIGAYPEWQIRTIIPIATLNAPKRQPSVYHYGDVGLGIKYRFLQETDWRPQAAFYPKITFPSGSPKKGIGNKTLTGTIPLWFQKNWGSWSVTPGGGYALNPARKHYNYFFGGILIKKKISESFMLGNELFAQGPHNLNNGSKLIYNFGGHYYFTPNTFILFSTGHSIAGAKTYIAFFGVGLTWGPQNPL